MEQCTVESRVVRSIEASIGIEKRMLEDRGLVLTIVRAAEIVIGAIRAGRKIMFFGNGGSAADAQHLAAEFVGRFAFNRPALAALALSVNTSCVTAIGNDYGFDNIFARQLEALACEGDVAFGISTSGGSENVIRGLTVAKGRGVHRIGLTGQNGGKLKEIAECCISVPSTVTARIQESHILIGHVIAELVEADLFQEC